MFGRKKLHLYGIFAECCKGDNIEFVENNEDKGWYRCKTCQRMFTGRRMIDGVEEQ